LGRVERIERESQLPEQRIGHPLDSANGLSRRRLQGDLLGCIAVGRQPDATTTPLGRALEAQGAKIDAREVRCSDAG
jgi:hypothetical protein